MTGAWPPRRSRRFRRDGDRGSAVPSKASVIAGAFALSAALAGGTAYVLDRTWETAHRAAEVSLESTARIVTHTVNRQFLRVDSTLASLPALFAAMGGAGRPVEPGEASRLLAGLSLQTSSLRDILLVAPGGAVWSAARPRLTRRTLPAGTEALAAQAARGAASLAGPARNPLTGEWSIYIARTVTLPGRGELLAVAELAIPSFTGLVGEVAGLPGLTVYLEQGDGRLLAGIPHDELRMGRALPFAVAGLRRDGRAFDLSAGVAKRARIAVARPTLYGDVSVSLVLDADVAMADWARDRNRLLVAVGLAELLLVACAAAILAALRRQDRLERERGRMSRRLENAIEGMSDGFVMWDEEDRLITANARYRELYAISAPFIRPGARFEDILREGAERGQYPQAGDDIDGWVREIVAWHRGDRGQIERLLPDGRWILITERRTRGGEIVGIRTDITALKTALEELEAANARANEAVAKVQARNAALVERERRISYLAHHDPLTGLHNRAVFRGALDELLQGARAPGETLAVLYLDLDRFKTINDSLGHPVGDALLRQVAARLRDCVRGGDVLARLGGDEFAVAALFADAEAAALELGTRIIARVSEPYLVEGRPMSIGASVGVAVAAGEAADADALLKKADMALYEAKTGGRGLCRLFEPEVEARLHARIGLERDLREAIRTRQFELAYQPVFGLRDERPRAFEALIRWDHPTRGRVSPAEFIPLAEETGLIEAIGEIVIETAIADAASLPGGVGVAVNLSPVQLRSDRIVTTIREALARSGVEPGRLEVEITETALLQDDETVRGILGRLRSDGVRIVLDDFGTGYASLSYLHTFPFQKVKIDQSFVRAMPGSRESIAIVRAITALAGELGMTTTAEGVETEEQLAHVRAAGCTEAQGFLLGRPGPILGAMALLGGRAAPARAAGEARAVA